MAVKRIGFLDNFTGTGGMAGRTRYGMGGGVRPVAPRAWGPGGAGWQNQQGLPATARPKVNTGWAGATDASGVPASAGLGGFGADGKPTAAITAGVTPAAEKRPVTLEDPAIASDPVLLKVRKLAQGQRDDAGTSALARKKQLAIQTGDSGLAREFGLDDTVAQLAAQNPLSNLAVIRDQGVKEERAFNEDANKANLFFSGYRGEQLGELAKALLTAEAQTQARAREGFSGIESELLGATAGADRLEMDAETAAYERALAAGLGTEQVPVDLGAGAPVTDPVAFGENIVSAPGGGAPFDANDPYFGGGISDIAAELLGIPGAKRQPRSPLEALLR